MLLPISSPPRLGERHTIKIGALTCHVEYPEGSSRWHGSSPADYGYINGYIGADGDEMDCYIGKDRQSPRVYVVSQGQVGNPTVFDEHKVMLGYASKDQALADYMAGHTESSQIFMNVASLSMQDFLRWLKHGNHNKPLKGNVAFPSSSSVRKFF